MPRDYFPAIEAGFREAAQSGVIAGYPVVDVKVQLTDGSYHEVDSSEIAFKVASSMAFKNAARKAGPVVLEPIMKMQVITPAEFLGEVLGDLNSRRGQIQSMEGQAGTQTVVANVPLAETFPVRHEFALSHYRPRKFRDGTRSLRGSPGCCEQNRGGSLTKCPDRRLELC